MRNVIRLGFLTLFLHAALAQTQPEVAKILKKIGEVYKDVSQYEFEVDTAANENGSRTISHAHLAFTPPNRYRIEGAFPLPGVNAQDANLNEGVIVYDGSTVWFYFLKQNQYASFPVSALTADDSGDMMPEAVDHFLMWRYRAAADFASGAKLLREESIEIAGAKVDCYVVTVSPEKRGLAYTWWVDKKPIAFCARTMPEIASRLRLSDLMSRSATNFSGSCRLRERESCKRRRDIFQAPRNSAM